MQQILDGRNQRIAQEGCVVCSQEITNPICAKCHKNHILVWLQDHPIAEDVKKEIQSNINKKFAVNARRAVGSCENRGSA